MTDNIFDKCAKVAGLIMLFAISGLVTVCCIYASWFILSGEHLS